MVEDISEGDVICGGSHGRIGTEFSTISDR